MRKGFLGSLAGLFVGAGLGLAQAPAPSDGPGSLGPIAQVGADTPAQAAPAQPRSPYWPNPAAKLDCFSPYTNTVLPQNCGVSVDTRECLWGSANYLLLWVKKGPETVPLVTTGPDASLGILGNPGTTVVFGGSGFDFRAFSGGEFTAGFWFNRERDLGVEGSGFFTEDRTEAFSASSGATGSPLFARPQINALATPPFETSQLISGSGTFSGNIGINADSQIYGFEVDLTARYAYSSNTTVDFLAGPRYVHLDENLNIAQFSNVLAGGVAGFAGATLTPGSSVSIYDHFSTLNQFYGGQVGARVEYSQGSLFVRVLGKLALGDSNEKTNVAGLTSATLPGGTAMRTAGGLLALSTNSGRNSHDEFAAVPEIGVTFGYAITPLLRLTLGYSFLYWSDVARPGDQVSRIVNPALIPTSTIFGTPGGAAQPAPNFNRSDFWAQGLSFGIELRY
jgi:hypothetical protein